MCVTLHSTRTSIPLRTFSLHATSFIWFIWNWCRRVYMPHRSNHRVSLPDAKRYLLHLNEKWRAVTKHPCLTSWGWERAVQWQSMMCYNSAEVNKDITDWQKIFPSCFRLPREDYWKTDTQPFRCNFTSRFISGVAEPCNVTPLSLLLKWNISLCVFLLFFSGN